MHSLESVYPDYATQTSPHQIPCTCHPDLFTWRWSLSAFPVTCNLQVSPLMELLLCTGLPDPLPSDLEFTSTLALLALLLLFFWSSFSFLEISFPLEHLDWLACGLPCLQTHQSPWSLCPSESPHLISYCGKIALNEDLRVPFIMTFILCL